jgi:diguanylate cyclase (GGDEF)-like protein/excisionase family DNA binding protein
MNQGDTGREPPTSPADSDLREKVAVVLAARAQAIVNDSVAVFPWSRPQPLDAAFCERLGQCLLQLLTSGVRDGQLDPRSGTVADVVRLASERALPVDNLFGYAYLVERIALDEVAVDDSLGATSEAWPLAAQVIRRASFDLLAAVAERWRLEPGETAITDRLTTLYTRAVLEAVMAKEMLRAERHGQPIAFILFDVDQLAGLNDAFGYGVGDRILERLGILVRKYFRQDDWVARYSEDSIAVLLPDTLAEDAVTLAERVRGMVEERLTFRDYRTDRRIRITVSAAVVTAALVTSRPGEPGSIDGDRVVAEAEACLERAKKRGRNRVEHVEIQPAWFSIAEAARFLECSPARVRRLIARGTLPATRRGRHLRVERAAAEAYRNQPTLPISRQ